MSFNIAADIVKVTSSIVVTVDTLKFGPRQIIALERMVRTGLCEGNGVPARVARVVRKKHGAPVLTVSSHVAWHDVRPDNDAFFDKIAAAIVADKLLHPQAQPEPQWRREINEKIDLALKRRSPNGSFYFYGKEFPKTIRSVVKGFNFEIEVPSTPRFIDIEVWDGDYEVYI